MNTTPFATVLSDARRGRPEFLERWRAPALLVEQVSGRRPTELDGRSPYPLKSTRTPTRCCLGGAAVAEAPAYPYLEDANVVWVEKSPRNGFTQLVLLGRGAENDLRFDLDSVSLVHATFARSGDRWFVQDQGSKNGTFVNGERLSASALRRLCDGDTLRMGDALKARFFAPRALYDFLKIVLRVTAPPEASA